MKRFLSMIVMLLGMAVATNAMSYSQAREQALFLTDKMAYELNLTDDQYEAAYEINLDYLMSVNSYADLYGDYWRYRNLDLSYVLLDWQYRAFCDAAYFYRPLYYSAGNWHFGIYARYPHRDYFYFNRPTVYISYRGGHSWGRNNGRSWYNGRTYGPRPGDRHFGMRDGFNRGDFGNGRRQQFGSRQSSVGSRQSGVGSRQSGVVSRTIDNSSFGSRTSSTRTTVTRPSTSTSSSTDRKGVVGSRISQSTTSRTLPSTTFTPSARSNSSFGSSRSVSPSSSSSSSLGSLRSVSPSSGSSRSSSSSFGSSRSISPSSGSSRSGASFGGGSRSGGSSSAGSSRGGSFGSRR